jgi:hypothetical protein
VDRLITRAELAPGRWEARSRPSVNQGYPDPPEDHWTESAAPWHQQAAARRKNQVEEGGRGAGLGLIGLLRVSLKQTNTKTNTFHPNTCVSLVLVGTNTPQKTNTSKRW